MKNFKKITVVILSAALLCAVLLSACTKDEGLPYWNLSSTVAARFSDNGNYGFILTVEGSGEVRDYPSVKDAPWYAKSGRVTEIIIGGGITYIGDNAFAQTAVKTVTLPASVTAIGRNVFPENCIVYSNSRVEAADGRQIIPAGEAEPHGRAKHEQLGKPRPRRRGKGGGGFDGGKRLRYRRVAGAKFQAAEQLQRILVGRSDSRGKDKGNADRLQSILI